MNRGSNVGSDSPARPAIASMRPRFMNRGSKWSSDSRNANTTRFNEAPIHESGKSVRFDFGTATPGLLQ